MPDAATRHHIRTRLSSAPARAHVMTVPGPTVQAANIDQVSNEEASLPQLERHEPSFMGRRAGALTASGAAQQDRATSR